MDQQPIKDELFATDEDLREWAKEALKEADVNQFTPNQTKNLKSSAERAFLAECLDKVCRRVFDDDFTYIKFSNFFGLVRMEFCPYFPEYAISKRHIRTLAFEWIKANVPGKVIWHGSNHKGYIMRPNGVKTSYVGFQKFHAKYKNHIYPEKENYPFVPKDYLVLG